MLLKPLTYLALLIAGAAICLGGAINKGYIGFSVSNGKSGIEWDDETEGTVHEEEGAPPQEETQDLNLPEEETGEGAPSAEETGEGAPSVEETGEGASPAEETGEGAPSVEETGEGNPPAEETGEGNPPAEETGEGNPPGEETGSGDGNSGANGTEPEERPLTEEEIMAPPTEADMLLMMNDIVFPKGPGLKSGGIWPDRTLVYWLDRTITGNDRQIIERAMQIISSATCIKFRGATNQDRGYVWITRSQGSGCFSFIGRRGNRQPLNLGGFGWSSCMKVHIVVHELIHAIGFPHEQSRPDRDKFVRIMWQNLQQWSRNNFEIHGWAKMYTAYDYQSIMHYRSRDFSMNGRPTIVRVDGVNQEFSGVQMTALDVQKIKAMYSC